MSITGRLAVRRVPREAEGAYARSARPQRAGAPGEAGRRPTAAYAATKEGHAYAATHDLVDSLEREARLQAWLAEAHDHRAATPAFVRREQPAYLGR